MTTGYVSEAVVQGAKHAEIASVVVAPGPCGSPPPMRGELRRLGSAVHVLFGSVLRRRSTHVARPRASIAGPLAAL